MKQKKQNVLIVFLLLALAWSIALNWYQGNQVNRLMEEVDNMEYTQSILSSQIQEMENEEGNEYEQE